jgi:hypothetical protein
MVSLEKDYCKLVEHHCTWCFQSPNNCTEQNDPCVVLIVAVPMSQEVHLPEYSGRIISIIDIICIIDTRSKIKDD